MTETRIRFVVKYSEYEISLFLCNGLRYYIDSRSPSVRRQILTPNSPSYVIRIYTQMGLGINVCVVFT